MARETPRAASVGVSAALIQWPVLIFGLALLTALRLDEIDKMVPLWVGGVVGTAVGQLLARGRLRAWLSVFIIGNLLWLAPLVLAPVWSLLGASPWPAMETFIMAFAPAAFCGYLSLSERGALAAFWFPAVPWVVAILDRSSGVSLGGQGSWLALAALAVLFLGFLRARESRRVDLWRGHATTRLASAAGEAVLRKAPLRRAGQLAWMGAVGAVTLGLTGWIAPSLWRSDDVGGGRAAGVALSSEDGDDGWICCPSPTDAAQKKVKEYLPIHRAHGANAVDEPPPAGCVACVDGLPATSKTTVTLSEDPAAPKATAAPAAPSAKPSASAAAAPASPPPAAVPPVPSSDDKAASAKPARARPAATGRGPRVSSSFVLPPEVSLDPLLWALTLACAAVAAQIALRPLRRAIVLRHLQKPLWPETVDQRVSNLWQLMLVGLRDAGWQAAPGEQPQELARRVDLPGMKTCATVLERARHGVRVDGADLEAMESAARTAYRAARAKIGLAARAVAWLRWPL